MQLPAAEFGVPYHQSWRIEEAFKRLKHHHNLEHVSGLPQLAVPQDFHAKIVCDNLQSLATAATAATFHLPPARRVNRALHTRYSNH